MFKLFKSKKKIELNDQNENVEGAWIFVSHSNKDWRSVKEVRDYLENKGHKPLLFYLKCLEDATEINDLILREIDARNWFILCESENSRNSPWVQTEIDYIKQLDNKVFESINLDDPNGLQGQFYKLDRLSKRISVYLSYSHKDMDIARIFVDTFKDNDFTVYEPQEIKPGEKFVRQYKEAINDAVKNGFFIMLMTRNSLKSPRVKNEIEYALHQKLRHSYKNNILPISFIDPVDLLDTMPISLRRIQLGDFSKGKLEDNISNLIMDLKVRKMDL